MVLLEPRDPTAFQELPAGGFVAGASWFYFAFDLTLMGYVIWGKPAPKDIEALVRLLVRELDRPPHATLVDLEHLETVETGAFDALAAYTVSHQEALTEVVRHAAIVKPHASVSAAIVAGFFDVSSRPFPTSLWATREAALTHLGRTDAKALVEALDAVRMSVSGQSALLRELRLRLAARPASASLSEVARELGLSVRTLQRRLADHRTSFEAQLQDVRLSLAERLLTESDTPVTTLALELGFGTSQHFSTLFRTRTGETPSSFRGRRRPTD